MKHFFFFYFIFFGVLPGACALVFCISPSVVLLLVLLCSSWRPLARSSLYLKNKNPNLLNAIDTEVVQDMENSVPSSRLFQKTGIVDPRDAIVKEIQAHEVAMAELNNLSASRTVYQRNGTLFFRTTIQKATAVEQRLLDSSKTNLQKMNTQ